MTAVFANLASSILASSIDDTQTTLAITTGDEGSFPSPSGGDWSPIAIVDASGNIEYVKCTSRSGVSLTVERAQEGTVGRAFDAGARVSLRLTAAALAEKADADAVTAALADKADAAAVAAALAEKADADAVAAALAEKADADDLDPMARVDETAYSPEDIDQFLVNFGIRATDFGHVRLNSANGHGSINTKIRRFSTVVVNAGDDITYADSATLGATFTIATDGIYTISYVDQFNAASTFGLSLNSSELTTSIFSIAAGSILTAETTGGANLSSSVSWSGPLSAGDVIRPHTSGSPTGTTVNTVQFNISRGA